MQLTYLVNSSFQGSNRFNLQGVFICDMIYKKRMVALAILPSAWPPLGKDARARGRETYKYSSILCGCFGRAYYFKVIILELSFLVHNQHAIVLMAATKAIVLKKAFQNTVKLNFFISRTSFLKDVLRRSTAL